MKNIIPHDSYMIKMLIYNIITKKKLKLTYFNITAGFKKKIKKIKT